MIQNMHNLKDGYLESPGKGKACDLCGTSTDNLYPAKIIDPNDSDRTSDISICYMCYETLSEYSN